jgi:hypothetical protein
VNGQFEDPMRVARATETVTIDPAARPRFEKLASVAQHQIDAAESLGSFRGNAE